MFFNNHLGRIFTRKLPVFFVAAAFLAACSSPAAEEKSKGGTEKSQTVSVTVGKAEERDVPAYIQATGSVTADETSDIAPKVAGKITNVYANVGEFVASGKIIARIDDRDARLRLAEAQANVKQAKAAVRQAEARLGLAPNGKFNSSSIPEVRVPPMPITNSSLPN